MFKVKQLTFNIEYIAMQRFFDRYFPCIPSWKPCYLCSINPMIETINPKTPIPKVNISIPAEHIENKMAKSNIAIPSPIFFIETPPVPRYAVILVLLLLPYLLINQCLRKGESSLYRYNM